MMEVKQRMHLWILGVICIVSDRTIYPMMLDTVTDMTSLEKKLETSEQARKKERKRSLSSVSSELVEFSFQQKNLKDLLNDFSQKLNINILYPETETITTTVSFDAGRKITMAEAWDFVIMIMEQAGYTLVLRGTGTYILLTNTKSYKEPLPLYIGVDFNQLPDTMERIRYVYYFNNIQVVKQMGELNTILANILPAQDYKDQLQLDPNSNSMILTTRADMIKTVMQLISVLDESGFQQAVELLRLNHALATDIVTLFKNMLGGSTDAAKKGGFVTLGTATRARYFSDLVRVENLDPNNIRQLNTVVIMGKPVDIEQIKKFIKKYLDIPQEQANSFFHVVELQWVQASHVANLLNSLVSGSSSSSGQSTGTASLNSDLSFDPQIKIVAETIQVGNPAAPTPAANTGAATSAAGTPSPSTVQRGANKVVIACLPRDWARIDAIIKQLDLPQKQVIIEAMVIDLNLVFVRNLGSQIRTRGLIPSIFPKNMQAQAGLLLNNIIQPMSDPDYYSLLGDLSDILNPDYINAVNTGGSITTPNMSTTLPTNSGGQTSTGFNGSTVVMVDGGKDLTNGVWAFFQLLSSHTSSKVFTRPTILAMNNQQVLVSSIDYRNLPGSVSTSVNPTVNYQQVPAPVTINFTPLISANNVVNLQINMNLTTFASADLTSGDETIRGLQTNVSMKSGDVLILGGLNSENVVLSKTSVPFLEAIPIIGNFFTKRSKQATKTQLFILVRTTVVEPRSQGGMGPITRSAADFMADQLAYVEESFGNLKDPITRWFFTSDRDETCSEYFEEKLTDLPKFDYGESGVETHVGGEYRPATLRDPNPSTGNMRIGWFSNAKSNNPFASPPEKETESDSDKLARLLKDIQNPFVKRAAL